MNIEETEEDAVLVTQERVGPWASVMYIQLNMYHRGDIANVSTEIESRELRLLITNDYGKLRER